MKTKTGQYKFIFFGGGLVFLILAMVQWKVKKPMLLLERFFEGGGWIGVILLSVYAAFLIFKMSDPLETALWRKRSWTLFSVFFFLQLTIGLLGFDEFLMTGKLHFPVPAMIIGGPVYRMQISFMTILFFSTILLTGPAWCSHLCYFGVFDYLASLRGRPKKGTIKQLWQIKHSVLILVILAALILRFSGVSHLAAIIMAAVFGIAGLLIILLFSTRVNKMFHCVAFCPVGTLVRYVKCINPFSMYIDQSCNDCLACTAHCRYDALQKENISQRKPGLTCTYCGDCVVACHSASIKYKFFGLTPENARLLWITLTVSMHAVFLGLARI